MLLRREGEFQDGRKEPIELLSSGVWPPGELPLEAPPPAYQ